MRYLVLKPIKAFGKRYKRGQIVEDSQLRCPRILIGERKITPIKDEINNAVSSSISPAEEASPEASEQDKEVKKPVKLSFTKKED